MMMCTKRLFEADGKLVFVNACRQRVDSLYFRKHCAHTLLSKLTSLLVSFDASVPASVKDLQHVTI